jgi:hypothetical protein
MKKNKFPMTLQLFAEGDGDGAGGGNVSGAGASGEGTNNEPLSFDGFLAQEGNQAEFDRRVQKAIDTAVSNAQQKWQALTDDKLSEAEKLAKMNKEEKAAYMQQKKEKELSDRESAVARKELMAEAKNTLAEKKLPAGLAEVLNYTDAESCNKSIAAVEKAFQAAVEAAVQERLKGGEPMKKAPESDADSMEKQVEALIMGRM